MKMGSRQSKNVLDLKNPDDLRKHEAQTAIASARVKQKEMADRSKHLTNPEPMTKQKSNRVAYWDKKTENDYFTKSMNVKPKRLAK